MKRNKKRLVAAVAVVGALAAGGAAFTDQITNNTTDATVGYGTIDVQGHYVLSNANYVFNNDGSQIDKVNLTFTSTLGGQHVHVGFADSVDSANQSLQLTDCGPVAGTSVTCTLNSPEDVEQAQKLEVLAASN
jgi:hypothetical protein